ncbi:MAG: serine/threonine-protein phosphatase [Desulfobacterales bacterium]|jgi:PPM family protein phosphatase|nr:serine/threonine-protein phosphatase [Desulfobacteraceae bacterium]MBT4365582.1 serine/threonine-protein phosphatase [Desulfobacteraceae bacterium]MBT7085672.1 serine/threonine-protein phosphatase [Desulfobacterales bacterium]MBT7698070.1 serine/threonine-protein phosphatase [Desulfobacterales bacterium]
MDREKKTIKVETSSIAACGISDPGRVRSENEDSISLHEDGFCLLLADGMGGHERGSEASSTALEVISQHIQPDILSEKVMDTTQVEGIPTEINCLYSMVDDAVSKANAELQKRNKEANLERYMGTTLVGVVFVGIYILWFHVGDSRLYRWRDSKLQRLTSDHSAFSEWEVKGKKGEKPGKNVITRAIGPSKGAVPDIAWEEYKKGDLYFMCSDGLNDMIVEDEIINIMNEETDVNNLTQKLIDAANNAGGNDNVSVVISRV